jgi:hypothetical protein
VKMLILLLPLVLSACVSRPWKDFYGDTRSADVPADVRSFVNDAQGCNHFVGEDPYDTERAAFLKKNIDALCTGINERHNKLAAKYKSNAETHALITDVSSVFK